MQRKIIFYFALSICFIPLPDCNGIQDDQAVKMLRDFYADWISYHEKGRKNVSQDALAENRRSILRKYCTPGHLKEYENADLDYDPYLKAQMIEMKMLETLLISKDSISNNIYYVSYTYYGYKQTIKLSVVKESGVYKIDHIFRDN